MLAGL
ncbi:transposase domain protein, partial [Yersinia pestis PY-02]